MVSFVGNISQFLVVHAEASRQDLKHLGRWPFKRLGSRGGANPTNAIHFHDQHDAYYSFTNSSHHPVWYKGRSYPTSEHLFQAMKFLEGRPDVAEHIRTSERVNEAIAIAVDYQQHIAPSWYQHEVERMEEVLRLKFTQNNALRLELLETGDAELIQNSPVDAFWGKGAARSGRNELGKALMRLREELRAG